MSRLDRAPIRVFGAALLFCCAVSPASAAPLLLEVWRNGATDHAIVHVTVQEGAILLGAEEVPLLGVKVTASPKDGTIDLAKLAGLAVAIDQAGQRLLITAAPAALPRQMYDLGGGAAPSAASSEAGAILRYDLSATEADARRFGRALTGGANLGLDLFRDDARLSANGFGTFGAGGRIARLDSALTFDRPATLTHLSFGDAISVTPDWSRALRFGGIEYASDFSLAPGLITTPLPSFFGASDVPATVEVYNGAARLAAQSVAPGPFEIRNLPIVTGGGAATVVVRDVLGRETTQSLSLFTDKGLLSPGRTAFAVDLGFRRTGYGLASFGYDDPMLSADWRRGLSSTLTIETHGEAAPRLVQLGGGGEWSFGSGTVAAGLAGSMGEAGGGALASLSAQWRSGRFNLYGSGQYATPDFRDLASLDGALPPRWRLSAGASFDLRSAGALALSFTGEKPGRGDTQSLLNASWSLQLAGGKFLAVTALHDFTANANGGQLALSIPLGGRGLASLSATADDRRVSALALYDHPADPDGGFGYRLGLSSDPGQRFQGSARYVGRAAALDGGVALSNGAVALRADAAGALVLLRGSLFATHDPGEAVALVQTGAPDIHIYRENREVAVSDADGEALLTGLVPYAPNHIAIEPRDYPFTALVTTTDIEIAPPRRGAALASLVPLSRHPLMAQVARADGVIPSGARVLFDGDAMPLALGHDGQLFIADMEQGRLAEIDTGKGHCRVFITPDAAQGAMPRTPPLTCFREPSLAY